MEPLIFRNDDVSMNTDFILLDEMYDVIRLLYPQAEIWSCVTVFSKDSSHGSVYPDIPFKNKFITYFYDVDKACSVYYPPFGVKLVSHGLWHINHTHCGRELQEASILTSCKLLHTDTFVPPFNAYNDDTVSICNNNDIRLVKFEEGWKSLEHNKFNPAHRLWYFHSWRYNVKSLADAIYGYSKKF